MPSKKIQGLPRSKEGDKFLVIKESKRNKFQVIKLKKKKKKQ